MMKKILCCLILLSFMTPIISAWSSEPPQYGKKAADQYFLKRKRSVKTKVRRSPSSGAARYLSLHLGTFVSEDTYKWGGGGDNEVGRLNGGVTYRVGEWQNSMDLLFRADLMSYQVDEFSPVKLALMPVIAFPDARSQFPLYFGGGMGLGVFLKQVKGESSLSLDYQIVAGGRFYDVFDNVGLMFEVGLKNHILLFSDGQHNGVFVSAGTVFRF